MKYKVYHQQPNNHYINIEYTIDNWPAFIQHYEQTLTMNKERRDSAQNILIPNTKH